MQPTFRFSPMDEALVRVEENGKPVVYIGKILDSRTTDEGEGQYLVHYLGWNEIWDAWVFAKQIYELTEEALEDARDRGILAKQARGRIKNRAQNKTATTTTTTTTVATTSTTATSTLTTSNAEKEEKGEENEDEGNHLNNLRVSPRPARERTSTRKDLKRKREVDTGFDVSKSHPQSIHAHSTPPTLLPLTSYVITKGGIQYFRKYDHSPHARTKRVVGTRRKTNTVGKVAFPS
eukprot:TRINITY_DN11988_c0_g1_i2.p1 TRINITY_DN11988_c0_g1~~TRINITY_DN11988_c0_g1_i2.p1  ORF type:complete len:235 (-),score=40.12 TRINITY_DN11988_c0_g1_i2:746-1450(-)